MPVTGKTIGEICQQLEISGQSFNLEQARDEGRRDQATEKSGTKNARLNKLLAEAELDKVMLREITKGNW